MLDNWSSITGNVRSSASVSLRALAQNYSNLWWVQAETRSLISSFVSLTCSNTNVG